MLCALDTLQRLTDVVGLQRAQDHGTYLTVLEPKTGESYKVPVSSRLRVALDALPANGPAYFATRTGVEPHNRRNLVIRAFTRLCKTAGIPVGRRADGVTFHCLRHTGASRLLAAGVDMETVRQLGG